MGILDIIILAVIGIWFVAAVIYIIRQKRSGKSICGCSSCKGNCANCAGCCAEHNGIRGKKP